MTHRASLFTALMGLALGASTLAHASPRPPGFSQVSRADMPARPDPAKAPAMIDGSRQVRWLTVEGHMPIAPPKPAKKRPAGRPADQPIAPWGKDKDVGDYSLHAQSASWGEVEFEQPPAASSKPAPAPGKGAPRPLFQEAELRARGPGCLHVAQPNRDQFTTHQLTLSQAEGVVPLQFERVIYTADGARLDLAQVWFDARTLGVQPIASRKAALTRLLPTQQGIDVWGVRENGGMRVLVTLSPTAVGSQKGQYNALPCSFSRTLLLDTPLGHQSTATLVPYIWRQLTPGQPNLTTMPQPFTLTASLSRVSRDPEPLLSVGLRADATVPAMPEPQIDHLSA